MTPVPSLVKYALASALSLSFASAQTVYTNPVGYMTATIEGSEEGKFQAIGFPLQNPIILSGVVEAVTDSTFTDSSISWIPEAGLLNSLGESYYYVTFGSSSEALLPANIIGIDGGSIEVNMSGLDTVLSVGDTYSIRAHRTVGDVFGVNNEAGLIEGNPQTADKIFLTDDDGNLVILYYEELFGIGGWQSTAFDTGNPHEKIIGPQQSALIFSKLPQNESIELTSVGDVKVQAAKTRIRSGFNILASRFPVEISLTDLPFLENGLVSGSAQTADLIYVPNDSTGSFDIYYHQELFGLSAWNKITPTGTEEVSEILVPPGGGYLILRRNGDSDFDITETLTL